MSKTIQIFGVPMDLGQRRRGVDMGPSAVRYAGLSARLSALGYQLTDNGNLSVPLPENEPPDTSHARHLQSIAGVCRAVYDEALACVQRQDIAIFLGGDHSISIGTVSAVTSSSERVGVIWVDAHGDFNTPDITPSGNVHGMALAALLGQGAPELTGIGRPDTKLTAAQTVLFGTRDLDGAERQAVRAAGVLVVTMREIDEVGVAAAARKALEYLSGVARLHVSLDMDALDPMEAPGVGTPVSGGLTFREAHLLMETLADTGKVSSLDIVEVNPILDDRNRTARLAVDLAS
ncbi:MAG: arginase, partial [Anaerolineales bacterium]